MSDGLVDPAPLRDEINKKIAHLFDLNQKVVSVLRQQANDFTKIATFFAEQSQRAFEIANAIADLSIVASNNTSNIIIAEFGHDDDEDLANPAEEEESDDD